MTENDAATVTAPVHTRADYVTAKTVSHDDYYEQFVTIETKLRVLSVFSLPELVAAYEEDEHFNTIPLQVWDALSWLSKNPQENPRSTSGPFYAVLPFDRGAAAAAGEDVTRATLVCIAKQAARILVDEARQKA